MVAPLGRPGLPDTNDTIYHIQRIAALADLQRDGVLWTRWLPDVAYGYGSPVFNYYAPLAYAPALVACLFGMGPVAAYKLAAAATVFGSGLAMYALARAFAAPVASLGAAVTYACLPYQAFDLYVRGALPESTALVWLPLIALSLIRLRGGGGLWASLLGVSTAALSLTHNITAMFGALAFGSLALFAARGAQVGARQFLLRCLQGVGLGALLGSTYWLPAVAERDAAQLAEALVSWDVFKTYFIGFELPFYLDPIYDYSRDARPGLIHTLLLVIGVFVVLANRQRTWLGAWAALTGMAAWLGQTALAIPLFALVPPFQFIQFPFRFLTFMALATAVATALAIQRLGGRRWLAGAAAAVTVACTTASATLALPDARVLATDRFFTPEGTIRSEQANQGTGTTVFGEFLPSTTTDATRLRRDLLDLEGARRRDRSVEPSAMDVEVREWRSGFIALHVRTPRPERLALHQFWFPGWQLAVDGQARAPVRTTPRGLLAVDLPPGEHDVQFWWGWSTPRLVGVALSLLGAGFLVAAQLATARRALPIVAAGLLVTACTMPTTAVRQLKPVPSGTRLADQVALIGAAVDARHLPDLGVIQLGLAWHALIDGPDPFDVAVRATSGDQTHQSRWIHGPMVRAWERGEVVRTMSDVRLPDDWWVGRPLQAISLELTVNQSAPTGRPAPAPLAVNLGSVDPPPQSPPASRAGMATAPRPTVSNLDLSGVSIERPGGGLAPRGSTVAVTVGWIATGPAPGEVVSALALRGGGAAVAAEPRVVGDWFNPPPYWQAGDRFSQHLRLRLPPDLTPGPYTLLLRVSTRSRSWMGLAAEGVPRGRASADLEIGTLNVAP
ncbi:MAG: 6-pyruvoyl-tetrahydropterin synthase-related protein [Chloroflexota bacterium]